MLGAAALFARPAHAEALEDTLVIRTTGGVFEAALKRNFFEPFTAATGVRVIPVAASDSEMQAKAAAMLQAGHVEWDIISPQFTELDNLSRLLVDLGDCAGIPSTKAAMPGTCGRYGMLYLMGAQVMAWNTQAFPERKPQGWKDFWDIEGFPGRRALSNSGGPFANLVAALIADGVPADKLFPLDLDRAFRKLDQIKPHIAVWWHTGDQSQQMWRGSDIAMSLMWSGRAYATKHGGFPLAWTYENTLADFGAWAILKDCPHPKAARAFLDFYIGSPEHDATFSREMGYATPNLQAAAMLSSEEKQELISSPETFSKIIQMDPAWLEANRAAVLERWNRWVSA
ncbi:MAG: ABC transporter substrate-binding protein [Acidisphaera sp.]|nr:ABC transporter substrate-binding protein [Acidisphaera sp.]